MLIWLKKKKKKLVQQSENNRELFENSNFIAVSFGAAPPLNTQEMMILSLDIITLSTASLP